jgi:hypothetical protein
VGVVEEGGDANVPERLEDTAARGVTRVAVPGIPVGGTRAPPSTPSRAIRGGLDGLEMSKHGGDGAQLCLHRRRRLPARHVVALRIAPNRQEQGAKEGSVVREVVSTCHRGVPQTQAACYWRVSALAFRALARRSIVYRLLVHAFDAWWMPCSCRPRRYMRSYR